MLNRPRISTSKYVVPPSVRMGQEWSGGNLVVVSGASSEAMRELALSLRPADLKEVLAWGIQPLAAIRLSCSSSTQVYTVRFRGRLIMIFGVGPKSFNGTPAGGIWMLSTGLAEKHMFKIARHAHRWLDEFHCEYSILWNVAHIQNALHLRWLKWLGFRQCPDSAPGKEFLKFARYSNPHPKQEQAS